MSRLWLAQPSSGAIFATLDWPDGQRLPLVGEELRTRQVTYSVRRLGWDNTIAPQLGFVPVAYVLQEAT